MTSEVEDRMKLSEFSPMARRSFSSRLDSTKQLFIKRLPDPAAYGSTTYLSKILSRNARSEIGMNAEFYSLEIVIWLNIHIITDTLLETLEGLAMENNQ